MSELQPPGANPDKDALARSPAGRRLIAQLTIYNKGDFARLRQYIAESYSPALLEEEPVGARLMAFRAQYAQTGRLKVFQTVAAGEHEVAVLLEAERDGMLYVQHLMVTEAYPHAIHAFHHAKAS